MKRARLRGMVGFGMLCAVGCADGKGPTQVAGDDGKGVTVDVMTPIPLTVMGDTTYHGFAGGLYPGGNGMPTTHRQAGLAAASRVRPLDQTGRADPEGRYVLLSIGMSNATQEFCSGDSTYPCSAWSFVGQALADPDVDDAALELVNGASSGEEARVWADPRSPSYDRVRDEDLSPRGLSEQQVRAVWVKVANRRPSVALPAAGADAFALERLLGDIARALRVRYPNVEMVFLSSRIYAGYAMGPLNPEPYAYESGFSVKWVIEAQIAQAASGSVDDQAGDLQLGVVAPWLGWGPYLWADGSNPTPDGLAWQPTDFEADGTHPGPSGETKVGAALLSFFKTSPVTASWFLR